MVQVEPPDHSLLGNSKEAVGEDGEEGREFSVSLMGEIGGDRRGEEDLPVGAFSLGGDGGGTGMERRVDSRISDLERVELPRQGNRAGWV